MRLGSFVEAVLLLLRIVMLLLVDTITLLWKDGGEQASIMNHGSATFHCQHAAKRDDFHRWKSRIRKILDGSRLHAGFDESGKIQKRNLETKRNALLRGLPQKYFYVS